MKKLAVVILAAGEGTRMKSETPKVLHTLCGRPMVRWVLAAVKKLAPAKIVMVVGHGGQLVREHLADEKILFVEQKKRLGSGHALMQADRALKNFRGDILVLCADTPLITSETLSALIRQHRARRNSATILSARFPNPFSYGRIVREASGRVAAIVEEKDGTPEQRAINEINSGIYCFKSPELWAVLKRIKPNNVKHEYYLTDVIAILNSRGSAVDARIAGNADEIMGVNHRKDLAIAQKVLRTGILNRWMLDGVTIHNPDATYIGPDVTIGRDTVIYPQTMIEGNTIIGSGCKIGPFSFISNTRAGDRVEIRSSFVYDSRIAADVKIGPYAHLRPGSVLEAGSKVGNFSEVKKSLIGEGSKVNHLSYIGDAVIGKGVNVGAGTITCNYDGVRKHQTVIRDRVFVGSNVNLVAPVTVGPGALIAAGSTITDDIPANTLAFARARQVNKPRKK